jgi:asparagine synthase (glutamine-hydrolysing)
VLHPELRPLARHAGRHLWTHWASSRGRGLLARQQQLDYDLYLPDDILVKVDRASMAHSIEVRSPFLDYRVVEWAARLPRGALLSERAGKQPLRALGATLLPGSVASGAKRGFGIPLRDWFRHADGQRLARARLLGDDARRRGLWDVARVARVLDAHASRDGRDFGPLLWRLLVLEAWARWYLDARELAMEPPLLVDARVPAGLTSAR